MQNKCIARKKKHKAVRAYVFPFFCCLHSSLCLCSCLAPTVVCAYSHHSLWQSHSNSAAAAHSTWSLEQVNILQIRWSVCLCLGTRCWVCEVVNVADLTGWWATKSCSLSSTLLSLVSSPCLQLLAMLERQWGRQTDRWTLTDLCVLANNIGLDRMVEGESSTQLIFLRWYNLLVKNEFWQWQFNGAAEWQKKASELTGFRLNKCLKSLSTAFTDVPCMLFETEIMWKWDEQH